MPHNPPLQARSRRTLERLVHATRELIDERGVSDTSIGDIVERAGSSVGSFYARFASKDDLLDYVQGQMWEEAVGRWRSGLGSEEWKEMSLEGVVRGVIRLFSESEGTGVGIRTALGLQVDDSASKRFEAEIEGGAEGLILSRRAHLDHQDPEYAAAFAARLARVGVRALHAEDRRAARTTLEEDLHQLGTAVYAYLRGARAAGSDSVEYFDVWG
jgi:AcrR family transcriptional regulator